MRLWARLAAVLAVVAVVPVLVVGAFAMIVAGRGALDESRARLFREAVDQAEFVDRWVADYAEALLVKPKLFDADLEAQEELQGFLRLVYLDLPAAVTVVMVDGDGRAVTDPVFRTVGSSDRVASSPQRAQALIERLPLTSAMDRPELVHLGAAWLPGGFDGQPSIPMALAVRATGPSKDRRILGVELNLELAQQLTAGTTADHAIALLDARGSPLLGSEHPLIDGQVLDLLQPLVGQAADFGVDGLRGEVLGAIVHLPVSQWSVVVIEPAAVVLGPASDIRRTLVIIALVAIIIAVVLAFALAGEISEPIERLRDAAVALGDGRAGQQAEVDRSDEIGDLARAFNHMSGRLAANHAEITAQQREIEAFNVELQERVEQRTEELRQAQDQLVRSGQLAAVAEVGAGLAHELNNPLAAILGFTQLLRHRHAGSDDEALFADLEAQATRCREVVAAMLKFASGEVDPQSTPVIVLQDVLRDVVELVRGPFRQRGVELDLEQASTDHRVRIDPVQGARILAQVLGAIRAGLPQGSSVRVGSDRGDGGVHVMITSDQAIGVEASTRDDWEASSLGLWVARQMLDRLGGRLERVDAHRWTVVVPEA